MVTTDAAMQTGRHATWGLHRPTRGALRTRLFAVALVLAVVGAIGLAAPAPSEATGLPEADEVLFSLPVGDPISYEGLGEEQLTWGPAGIAAGEDGTIWIADGAKHRVLGFDREGALLQAVDISPWVVGLSGIDAFDDKLVVLDVAAVEPSVVVLDQATGRVVDTLPLPSSAHLAQGLSGVAVMADGTIAAELEGGTRLVAVARLSRSSARVEQVESMLTAYDTEAGHVRIVGASDPAADGSATIEVGDAEVSLPVENTAGTVTLVGVAAGAVYVTLDEVSQQPDGTVLVDTTVQALDATGQSLGTARVPLSDMTARPQQPVAVSGDGEVIALVPREATIDVVSLALTDELDTVLPAFDPPTPSKAGSDAGTASCVHRSTMSNIDFSYRNNSKYLSSTNIGGACSGRTKPRYLGSAGTYSSVPYQWGGFSSVAQFNNNMSPSTGRAGDINSASWVGCAYGVDCSGFVSRVWQLANHHYTGALPSVSTAIPASYLKVNDLFNLVGSHAILYKSTSGNGYYVSESTTAGSYDRVIYRWISTSYVSSYSTRRYNNVCCDPNVEVCPIVGTT